MTCSAAVRCAPHPGTAAVLFAVYDPSTGSFYAEPGQSKLNAYLNGSLLRASEELAPGDELSFGDCVLALHPLCGPDFSWGRRSGGV
jgi:hypothetical protein